MTPEPRVSIVLPTYNGSDYLREAVDSCLGQTYRDIEVIAVVDGSTDNTLEILREYDDPRLVIREKPNQGLPAALNTGFEMVRGEYLSWTSDDNVFEADAVQEMVTYLDRHEDVAMVCTDFITVDASGAQIGYNSSDWACFLYRRSAAEQVGVYRTEFQMVEDVDFFVRLEHVAGPIHRIRRPLYRYRTHGGSLSAKKARQWHLASLRWHHDLEQQGIGNRDLQALFRERLGLAAIHRDPDLLRAIVDLAGELGMPNCRELDARARWLGNPLGWWFNRFHVALRSLRQKIRSRVRLARTGR